MMQKVPQLSVFFPAYNEEKNIKKTVLKAVKILNKVAQKWEILVVNDGSADKTGEIVKKIEKQNRNVKLINHKKNRGYGGALKTGLSKCQYSLICYTDSDGQFNLSEITKFLSRIKTNDLVIGYRKKRTDKLFRRILARVLKLANFILFGLKVKDVDCGFKLFRKKVIEKVGKLETESAITETEFIVKAKRLGLKISELGVEHNSRIDGQQTGGKLKVIFKAGVEAMRLWWALLNKKEFFFLFFLTGFSAFLRLYRLEDLMSYLGDEGRDMLILMDILKGKNFPLIGPPTSIGKLYLGPIYYYFIAPFAWIFKMNPVGPAVFVALLGTFTVPLIFLVSKKIFDSSAAFFTSVLYAVSPVVVRLSRSSWNPNPMPFFTLSLILSLFYWQQTKKNKFLYLAALCFGIMMQLHYVAIFLSPFLVFLIFYLGKKIKLKKKKSFLIAVLVFFLLLSPLLIFDLKHNFINLKGFIDIYQTRSVSGFSLYDLLSHSRDRLRQLFSLFFGFSEREWKNNLMIVVTLFIVLKNCFQEKKSARLLIYGLFFWAILALGIYRKSTFEHYLTFLFPFPAFLLGYSLSFIFKKGKLLKVVSLTTFFLVLVWMGKQTWQYLSRPASLNVKLVKSIARLVEKESQGKPFNFALLTYSNYDASYRYFFRLWQVPAVFETEVADQLFVVCEDQEICQPEGNPKWEIALFDAAYDGQIEETGYWQPDSFIKVFKFTPKN